MTDLAILVRWLHVVAAASWLGEVVVINVVLVPSLTRRQGPDRRRFFFDVFPQLFRLASVLSMTTLVSGVVLLILNLGGDWHLLTDTRWGQFILLGGTLGLLLTVFHFLAEDRLTDIASVGQPIDEESPSDDDMATVVKNLRIVPRAGLIVIVVTFLSMMIASRGF